MDISDLFCMHSLSVCCYVIMRIPWPIIFLEHFLQRLWCCLSWVLFFRPFVRSWWFYQNYRCSERWSQWFHSISCINHMSWSYRRRWCSSLCCPIYKIHHSWSNDLEFIFILSLSLAPLCMDLISFVAILHILPQQGFKLFFIIDHICDALFLLLWRAIICSLLAKKYQSYQIAWLHNIKPTYKINITYEDWNFKISLNFIVITKKCCYLHFRWCKSRLYKTFPWFIPQGFEVRLWINQGTLLFLFNDTQTCRTLDGVSSPFVLVSWL